MTIVEFRDILIERGIQSIHEAKYSEHKKRGAIAGFEICRTLDTPQSFEWMLKERYQAEHALFYRLTEEDRRSEEKRKEYWEFRMATIQIEYVYERMKVGWKMNPLSARAVLDYAEIVGVEGE